MGGLPGDRSRGPPRFEGDRPRFGDRDGYRGGLVVTRVEPLGNSNLLSGVPVEGVALVVGQVAMVQGRLAQVFLEPPLFQNFGSCLEEFKMQAEIVLFSILKAYPISFWYYIIVW
ncbi:uncharacterized protein LOC130752644 isoform X1 [Actinidia eriantha]|uniref:uncharacterized protein LOC130752644 isoform X1 n=1 Tax=Actinidia eriantha TaxID=165200 RepID=UPI002588EB1B|nr:uncharacterized protein LOC130752644 isoform X1 [Actinidia eriantha]XP_057462444.1 uncharacterized protein LOC130752644 isoform X1 [Actinidia eriantha]